MKKGKATVSIGLIYVILLGVFNLLVFTIFKTHTKVFWLSYAFMTVAFIVQILSMFLSFKTADVETAFFGIPLASFSIYYLCASLIVGAVFMVFQNAGFTLALVIQTLILAAFLIIAIISLLARDGVLLSQCSSRLPAGHAGPGPARLPYPGRTGRAFSWPLSSPAQSCPRCSPRTFGWKVGLSACHPGIA